MINAEIEALLNEAKDTKQLLKTNQRYMEEPIRESEGVMTLLKVSRGSLKNWRDQGIIEFSPINGKFFYYRVSAINKMLAKHLQKIRSVMIDLRTIIEMVIKNNPSLDKEDLYNAVLKKIRKEWFLTEDELMAVEDEVAERLSNF